MNLSVENITKSFDKKIILKNLSFQVSDGDFIYLKGSNGIGKTTLLKIISGIIEPDSGSINGNKIKIGYVSTNYRSFYLRLSVIENLNFFLSLQGIYNNTQNRINEVLRSLKILEIKNTPMMTLSSGQIKKVMFARSILGNPSLFLFDELFTNLDKSSIINISNYIKTHIALKNKPFIWVSHREDEITDITNKNINLDEHINL